MWHSAKLKLTANFQKKKFKDFLKIIIGAADAGPLCLKKRKKKKEEKDN